MLIVTRHDASKNPKSSRRVAFGSACATLRGWAGARPRARAAALAVCLTSLGWLTACSPVKEGISGVRLDADDRLVAVLAWCSGFEPSALRAYAVATDGRVDDVNNYSIYLERTGDAPTGLYLEIDILNPPQGWETRRTSDIDQSATYVIRAWDEDGSARVDSFPFRIDELQSPLAQGKILTKTYGDDGYESDLLTTEEFQDRAEQRCSD